MEVSQYLNGHIHIKKGEERKEKSEERKFLFNFKFFFSLFVVVAGGDERGEGKGSGLLIISRATSQYAEKPLVKQMTIYLW